MFFGRHEVTVDKKWRLTIPISLANNFLLLQESEDGCVRILLPPNNIREVADPVSAFLVEVKENSKGAQKRILIPSSLRESTSFFFGRKVTLAGRGDYLELWPRP